MVLIAIIALAALAGAGMLVTFVVLALMLGGSWPSDQKQRRFAAQKISDHLISGL